MKRHRFRFTFFLSICLLIPLIAGAAPVDIPDANLRAAIEKELNKQAEDPPITAADMVTLTSLSASDSNISDLTGLEHATKLTSLDLEGNSISDISVLAELTTLTSLDLDDNSILDISALAELTTLTSLKLNFNSVLDISAVSGLTNLERLELRNNSISDISDLSGLTNLTRLNLSENGFSDVSALVPVLSRLTNLTWLILSGNGISDVSALSEFTNLTSLELSANRISDISVLAGFTNLNSIDLDYNSISDISPLVENTGLGSGDTIRIIDNPLSYPSLHTHIPTLEEKGVRIEFTPRTPTAPWKISGTITESDNVLVVEVRDSNEKPFAGVPVTFTVTSGGGTLNVTSTTTNENGRAESTLTPGSDGEPNTASARVEGISEPVTFSDVPEPTVDIPDLNLRAAIEQSLGKASSSPITDADLANLTRLVASLANINDLTGLERATNLTELDLSFNSISDISALSGLTKLTRLNLRDNKVSNISTLSSLTNLTWLDLSGNGFSDVSVLVPVLSGLTNLTSLSLWENDISDVSALAGLTNLTSLSLLANRISDISVLAGFTNLNSIDLDYNLISDISPLVENTGLGSGDRIRIIDNPLSYPSLHTHIPTLEERGVRIEFTPRTPTTLLKISGTITESDNVLVVEVRDSKEKPFAGVPVTFTVTSGGGTLSVTSTTTNENGRAESTLTLGADGEPNTASASVEGISEPVTFTDVPEPTVDIPDFNLHAAIETALEKQVGDPITTADMANLSSLVASRANISDLTGLEHATNLTTLNLEENSVSDISSLRGLTSLTSLNLSENGFSDVSVLVPVLSDLTNLTSLSLGGNGISDVSALSGFTLLTTLDLEDNSISDISALAGLTNLTSLRLEDNMISNISPVSGLTKLTYLWLRRNMIADISPVADLTNLTGLWLRRNMIADISPVSGLTNLTSLGLMDNSISDISPLVANTGLGSGDRINILGNPLSYSSFYTHIPTLQSRGVRVQFDDTPPAAIEFDLSVPLGISLIHVPLKVTTVDGAAKTIESVGDLYDALGGSANVSILITHDPKTQRWIGYLGDRDKGKPANDKALTDGLGIIASMKAPASIRLSGSPLGTNGSSSITLYPGTNLVGVPLKDSRIAKVSDLLNLDGIRGNVSVIIVSDKGKFKVVVRPDDDGNIQISGGQSFILNTREMATVDITGDGWANAPGTTAAPPMALTGIQVAESTPILAVTGSIVSSVDGASLPRPLGSGFIVSPVDGASLPRLLGSGFIVSPVDGASLPRLLGSGFRVTIKNLSTGKVDTAVTDDDSVGYQLTFVELETGRAAQIGDTLEICVKSSYHPLGTAQSPNPLVGIQPLRYVITAEDVKRGHIQLGELVVYEIPAKTQLLPNYPNPFNPETWIPYRLAEDANVTLTIYDLSGGVVRRLNVGHQVAAAYERRDKAIYWDGRTEFGERVASGIYFYHLSAGDYSATRKMVILK